jgi:GGDEF domain-containing protein
MTVQSIPVLLMAGISLYAGFSHLMMFLNLKENRENLYFALTCFFVVFYDVMCVGLYNADSLAAGIGWQRGQYFAANGLMIGFIYFSFALTRTKANLFKKLFTAAAFLMISAGLMFPGLIFNASRPSVRKITILDFPITYYEARPWLLMNAFIVLIVFIAAYIFYILLRSMVREKKKGLIPLLIGFIVFAMSTLLDSAITNNTIRFVYTAEYAFLLLIFMMDFTVQRRFVRLFREVGSMNLRLEARVRERTADITKLSEELSAANKDLEEKNRTLGELVDRDSLTKLLNHAAFHSRLAEIFNESRRQHFSIAVIMMDIDHFKKINDGYGHPVGDRIIRKVAGVLTHGSRNYDVKARYEERADTAPSPIIRKYDVAGRYGGDEFAVILPYCSEKETGIVSDRICKQINEIKLEDLPGLEISVSMGGVVFDPELDCENEGLLMQAADRALYAAKKGGRNQVVIEKYGA